MASLRQRRSSCIRAALSATWAGTSAFGKRQRNMRCHLQLLDPDDGDLETPGPTSSLADCLLCAGPRGTKSKGPREAGTQVLAVDTSDVYMQPAGRARKPRPSPRLGVEHKGPKCSLSKRKLELLLVEPENSKRKKYYMA